MADIATALNNLATSILYSCTYRECETIEPFTVTPAVTQKSITAANSLKGLKASYVTILVRSMGTATYVAVGRPGGQEERLKNVGDVIEVQAPYMCYVDTSKILIRADVADAVIEVGGMLIPEGPLE